MKYFLPFLCCIFFFCCGCGTSTSDVEDWMKRQMWRHLLNTQQSALRIQSEAVEIGKNRWSVTSTILSVEGTAGKDLRHVHRTIHTIVFMDASGRLHYYFN